MIAVMQNPVYGRLYKFVYKNKVRVALCLDDKNELMRAWDFTRNDYRQFYHSKMGPVTDITSKMTTVVGFLQCDVEAAKDNGCLVYTDFDTDTLYAVRIKQPAST